MGQKHLSQVGRAKSDTAVMLCNGSACCAQVSIQKTVRYFFKTWYGYNSALRAGHCRPAFQSPDKPLVSDAFRSNSVDVEKGARHGDG